MKYFILLLLGFVSFSGHTNSMKRMYCMNINATTLVKSKKIKAQMLCHKIGEKKKFVLHMDYPMKEEAADFVSRALHAAANGENRLQVIYFEEGLKKSPLRDNLYRLESHKLHSLNMNFYKDD